MRSALTLLKAKNAQLHPVVQDALVSNLQPTQEARSSGPLPNFVEHDFVLVAWEAFTAGEKLSSRWPGPQTSSLINK